MKAHRRAVIPVALVLVLLSACSEAPPSTAGKKSEPATPAEPVTGQSAFFKMYGMAHGWAPDVQALRMRSVPLAQVKSEAGKAGAWEATFVSPSRGRARTYTYSVVEAEGNLHKGIFAGLEETYSGPRGQTQPFLTAAVKVDTDKAYETALKKSADYVKKNPDMPVTFLLELTPRHPGPAWRVIWGASASTSNYSILVDSATGDYMETLR
jgi:hypothetical protein